MNRRGFLSVFAGALAAPAIVRATSLMPVKVPVTLRPAPNIAVSGSGQTGYQIEVNPLPFGLHEGDVISIAGVYALDRADHRQLDVARQFVVTKTVGKGERSVAIYPPIKPRWWLQAKIDRPNVNESPENGAIVRLQAAASSVDFDARNRWIWPADFGALQTKSPYLSVVA